MASDLMEHFLKMETTRQLLTAEAKPPQPQLERNDNSRMEYQSIYFMDPPTKCKCCRLIFHVLEADDMCPGCYQQQGRRVPKKYPVRVLPISDSDQREIGTFTWVHIVQRKSTKNRLELQQYHMVEKYLKQRTLPGSHLPMRFKHYVGNGNFRAPLESFVYSSHSKYKNLLELGQLEDQISFLHKKGDTSIITMTHPDQFPALPVLLINFLTNLRERGLDLASLYLFSLGYHIKVGKVQPTNPLLVSCKQLLEGLQSRMKPNFDGNSVQIWIALVQEACWARESRPKRGRNKIDVGNKRVAGNRGKEGAESVYERAKDWVSEDSTGDEAEESMSDTDHQAKEETEDVAHQGGEGSLFQRAEPPRVDNITPIALLKPALINWIIRAKIVKKSEIHTWRNGKGKLFSMYLKDNSGIIHATAFNEVCSMFFNLIQEGKSYEFTFCNLQIAKQEFTKIPHIYEVLLTCKTTIEECLNLEISSCARTTSIQEVLLKIPFNTFIDVTANVEGRLEEPKLLSLGNRMVWKSIFSLRDETGTISLTVWGDRGLDIKEKDRIALKGVKVSPWSKKSLMTVPSTIFG